MALRSILNEDRPGHVSIRSFTRKIVLKWQPGLND